MGQQPDQKTLFNDLDHFMMGDYKGGASLPVIRSVGVWTMESVITGINIYYDGGIQREHHGTVGDEEKWDLAEGEFITKVTTKSGESLNMIKFETNIGDKKRFGGKFGNVSENEIPDGCAVVAFNGSHD